MDFNEFLHSISKKIKAPLDINEAVKAGRCTVVFDKRIALSLEYQDKGGKDGKDKRVYMFAPVMQITQALPENFFVSLLQIHLFGIVTHNCSFGYDAGGQRVLLFRVLPLEDNKPEKALEQFTDMVNQVEYWQDNLPIVARSLQASKANATTPSSAVAQRLRGGSPS